MKQTLCTRHVFHLTTILCLVSSLILHLPLRAQSPAKSGAGEARANQANESLAVPDDAEYFENLYRNFQKTYRLGPGDELSVRVAGQPDYSLEKARVSPVGAISHALLGDITVAGLTVEQLTKKLTTEFSEYLINPKVSVSLLEAHSAKVAVIGEVPRPGILVLDGPMTVFDAISASGGFLDTSKKSNVSLIRQTRSGRVQTLTVNLDRILKGKADVEENLPLQPGDTVIVHGNSRKALAAISTVAGFSSFLAFLGVFRGGK